VNLPEFLNAPYDGLRSIEVPAVAHHLYFWRGVDLMQEGNYEEAIGLLEKDAEIEPDFSRAHVNLGRAHAELGHLDVAVEQYRQALESNPDDVFAMNNLGLAMETLGHPEKARVQYEAALQRDPTLLLTRRSLARVLLAGPDPRAALPHLEKVVDVEPDDLETRWALAALYLGTQRPREAVHHLEALLTYAPDDVRALSTLAWLLATTSDDQLRDGGRAETLAAAAVKATARQRPEPLDAWAAALAELGRTEEAARAVREALALVRGRGSSLEKGLRARLKLYEAGRPYRAP